MHAQEVRNLIMDRTEEVRGSYAGQAVLTELRNETREAFKEAILRCDSDMRVCVIFNQMLKDLGVDYSFLYACIYAHTLDLVNEKFTVESSVTQNSVTFHISW